MVILGLMLCLSYHVYKFDRVNSCLVVSAPVSFTWIPAIEELYNQVFEFVLSETTCVCTFVMYGAMETCMEHSRVCALGACCMCMWCVRVYMSGEYFVQAKQKTNARKELRHLLPLPIAELIAEYLPEPVYKMQAFAERLQGQIDQEKALRYAAQDPNCWNRRRKRLHPPKSVTTQTEDDLLPIDMENQPPSPHEEKGEGVVRGLDEDVAHLQAPTQHEQKERDVKNSVLEDDSDDY